MPEHSFHSTSDRETVLGSIMESRRHVSRLECDIQETVLRSHKMISQSRDLLAKVDEVLVRTESIFSGRLRQLSDLRCDPPPYPSKFNPATSVPNKHNPIATARPVAMTGALGARCCVTSGLLTKKVATADAQFLSAANSDLRRRP